MKKTLKSKNVATIEFSKGKLKITSIQFKNEPTQDDLDEAEALAIKERV